MNKRIVHQRTITKADGRTLTFFGWAPHQGELVPDLPPVENGSAPYRRWHPLRHEWVSYAGARQGRTFLPDAGSCPLCPAGGERGLTEIPATNFEAAVFENRFPAFTMDAGDVAAPEGSEPALGKCEVVVFSPDHNGSLGGQSVERIELLFELWAARARAMMDEGGLLAVLPFETRGEEIGVTLPHPHGQIYGFGFVPDLLLKSAEAQKKEPIVAEMVSTLDAATILDDAPNAVSFVPPIARYPFETWIAPRERIAGPWELTNETRADMARLLKRSLLRLDGLFGKPMPYVLSVQVAPKGYEDSYHFTVQLWPLRRDVNKMKFLASVEQVSGVFLVDIPPDIAAAQLKSVEIPDA
ncbi:MAG: hypothetical protein RLN89_04160 [Parvibaculum sp.]